MLEIWILGATGRVGRAVAAELAARHLSPVLVGREAARLQKLAGQIGGDPRVVVAGSVEATVKALAQGKPGVVVNTIGPFTGTALPIVHACGPGTHYVDVSNELFSVTDVLGLHDNAVAASRCLVVGAGWGVLGTESVVLKLCEGRPPAERVRVDMVPMLGGDDQGPVGSALAASLIEGLIKGGRRYHDGRLARAGFGTDVERLKLPDGSTVATAGVPSGELEAARRASGASFVVAASSMAPTSTLARVILPVMAAILSVRMLREAAIRRLARVHVAPPAQQREASWAHARVQWSEGSIREGWLRAGEGMNFTAMVTAEVAARLARNEGRPGAWTPGALFGPGLAEKAGGQFILGQ